MFWDSWNEAKLSLTKDDYLQYKENDYASQIKQHIADLDTAIGELEKKELELDTQIEFGNLAPDKPLTIKANNFVSMSYGNYEEMTLKDGYFKTNDTLFDLYLNGIEENGDFPLYVQRAGGREEQINVQLEGSIVAQLKEFLKESPKPVDRIIYRLDNLRWSDDYNINLRLAELKSGEYIRKYGSGNEDNLYGPTSNNPDGKLFFVLADTITIGLHFSYAEKLKLAVKAKLLGTKKFLASDGERLWNEGVDRIKDVWSEKADKAQLFDELNYALESIKDGEINFDAELSKNGDKFKNSEYENNWNGLQKFCYRREK